MANIHITGAARGIGRSIALRLARDGHHVAVSDLASMEAALEETRAASEAHGVRSCAMAVDVTDLESVRSAVRNSVDALGSLDVMVANAGISQTRPLLDLDADAYDHVLAVNGRGVFLCYVEAARQMILQGRGGKIIGAGSIASFRGYPHSGAYCASKFAVRALTQVAAQEWAEYGITVNAYCPGVVDTVMWKEIDESLSEITGTSPGQPMRDMLKGVALGGPASGADVAGLVSYLVGPDSDYITGQSILVDGGLLFS